MKKLITHDGAFHTDDLFAYAALSIYLDKQGEAYEVIRTRDQEIIKTGDYVFDVGSEYDAARNRFDHHQAGGAGKRENGIEYASVGLVWKKFGAELCGSQKAADMIDKKLVSPVDASDNGIRLIEVKQDTMPYLIQSAFNSFNPSWKHTSNEAYLAGFFKCVEIAKNILINEMARAKDAVEAEDIIFTTYKNTKDKRIIVLEKKYPWYDQIQNYPEPIFVVYPKVDGSWGAEGVAVSRVSMEKKKDFPKAWGGLRDEELQKVSGVPDAVFCHRALFMTVAKSKEGAIKLAQIAIES